jgi:hypothetical protein
MWITPAGLINAWSSGFLHTGQGILFIVIDK